MRPAQRHASAEAQPWSSAAPIVHLDHPALLRFFRLRERMCIRLDRPRAHAEHVDTALVSLLPRHGELEAVLSGQTPLASRITYHRHAAKRNITVKQLDIHLLAIGLYGQQCALANAMGMPEPGGGREEQRSEE